MSELSRDSVRKFASLEADVAKQRGSFALFALFAREDVPDRWDLVVAAPWAGNSREAAKYLVEQIRTKFGSSELLNLSRIVAVEPTDPAVQALNQAFHVEHGSAEIRDSNLFGLQVKHAYIITSQRLTPTPAR